MAEWPLVGRNAELRHLSRIVAAHQATGAGGVVLAGPCGVGKTRLAREAMALAERAGYASARLAATRAAAGLPLGAVAPLVLSGAPDSGAVDDRGDLVRRCVSALEATAGGKPLVLVVDDAHLLDEMSALLLHQLVATGTALVITTVRSGEWVPEPVVDLWKDSLLERMSIRPLARAVLEELLSVVLGGPVDPAAVAELASHSGGNVLFLRELVSGALEDGTLVVDAGIWRLGQPLSPSDRLIELIEARLAGLDEADRSLLELVSFGEPLGQAELTALADPGAAEALERRALLMSSENGRRLEVRLGHPIYGDVLRSRIPALRVRAIVRALAEAVEATGARRRDDALRVASWRLLGGIADPDVMLAGAREARWRYDFLLAERLARSAVDAGAGFDARFLAAELAFLQGRSGQAEHELVELAQAAEDDEQRARVALLRVDNGVLWAGRSQLDILEEAERRVIDPAWRDELAAKRLSLIVVEQGPRACAEAAEPLLPQLSGHALALASIAVTWAWSRLGRIDAALELSTRARSAQLAITRPTAWYPWYHSLEHCYALNYAGRFEAAERVALSHHRQALGDRSPEAQGAFAVLLASTVNERGRVQTAVKQAQEALALYRQLGRTLTVRLSQTYLALALALAGRVQEAGKVIAELDALQSPDPFFNRIDAMQARAWVAVAEGQIARARQQLAEAAQMGAEIGDAVGTAAALHGIARLGDAVAVRNQLVAVTAEIDGDLAPARAAHVMALAAQDAKALRQVSLDFESIGADLLAAEAAADAAVASRRDGELRDTAAAQRRAALLIELCEGPVTPALQAVEARVRLTPAERETASLAAGGHSNRDIANQLYLSVRTIENRLQRVYDKLGVAGRDELAEALTSGIRQP